MINQYKNRRRKGAALPMALGAMLVISIAAASFIGQTNTGMRVAARQVQEVQTTHLAEAATQAVLRNLWRNFKVSQSFASMDSSCNGASIAVPKVSQSGSITNAGAFAGSVIGYSIPNTAAGNPDTYSRIVTVRAVGFLDRNNNGVLNSGEPRKVVDVIARFSLNRSQVFDYTYFANNYGWMYGFSETQLIVNGDMRANGDFEFQGGYPTVNGSVIGSMNEKLSPPAAGLLNDYPVKWDNSRYATSAASNGRMRQVYNSSIHGNAGTNTFENYRDFVFQSTASIEDNRTFGAYAGDATGIRGWTKGSSATTPTVNVLDTRPTEELIMPDLSDLSRYTALSQSYVDTKATYSDGTANPRAGQGAFVEVWNNSTNSYQRLSTNGVVTGSAALIGTATRPIRIHGPVTFTQDAVIKGYVEGQGTIYTGRNTHIVGSLRYVDPPDFRGANPVSVDNANEKKTMLGLAARGSVMMGNVASFTSTTLNYMRPPFTKGRYDDMGNWIPPFDASQVDATGFQRYQSVMGNSYINSISESVNQIDAILYTNFVGGGNLGTGGGGVQFNGTIISKDEAMVIFSLPMTMNYDNRIRERSSTQTPLIDIQLPRSPSMFRATWQDRGFGTY